MLPKIRLHDLRHTHATLALQAGVHPKVVSERLGHATVSITLDTYSHAIPALQEEAAALIAGLVVRRQVRTPPVAQKRPLPLAWGIDSSSAAGPVTRPSCPARAGAEGSCDPVKTSPEPE